MLQVKRPVGFLPPVALASVFFELLCKESVESARRASSRCVRGGICWENGVLASWCLCAALDTIQDSVMIDERSAHWAALLDPAWVWTSREATLLKGGKALVLTWIRNFRSRLDHFRFFHYLAEIFASETFEHSIIVWMPLHISSLLIHPSKRSNLPAPEA